MGKSAPAYLSIAVLVSAAISQFPSSTATSDFKYTFTVHSHYDSTELFAEAFWRFYTDNETLAANCPKLYALMSRVCPAPDN